MATTKTLIDSLFYTNPATSDITEATFTLPYATCSTAAATAAKTVDCSNFVALAEGASIVIKFTYANTSSAPVTLKVGNTDAKTIVTTDGQQLSGKNISPWKANSIVKFVYDGTNWRANAEITRKDLADAISLNDALVYKGIIPVSNTSGNFATNHPSSVNKGWTYKVSTNGYLGEIKVEPGDMVIFNTTTTATTNTAYFDVIQGNIDLDALRGIFSEPNHTHPYVHTHKVSHTPAGTISTKKFTPEGTVTSAFTGTAADLSGTVSIDKGGTHTHTFTGTAAGHTHTFTGSQGNVSVSGTTSGSNTKASLTPDGNIVERTVNSTYTKNYTPKGTITATFGGTAAQHNHTFTGTSTNLSTTFTPSGSNASTSITPAGTNTEDSHTHTLDLAATFTGTQGTGSSGNSKFLTGAITVTENGSHSHSVTISKGTISTSTPANYTPEGHVPSMTVSPSTNDKPTVIKTAALSGGSHTHTPASLSMSATNKKLSITFGGGSGSYAAPTLATTTATVFGSTTTFTAPQTNIVGTAVRLNASTNSAGSHSHTASATSSPVSVSYTPSGTISFSEDCSVSTHRHTHTFEGTAAGHTHAFTGTEGNISISYAPAGTISTKSLTPAGTVTATFTGTDTHLDFVGTAAEHNHTFTGSSITSTGTFTPVGEISSTSVTPAGTLSDSGYHNHTASLAMADYTPTGTIESEFVGTEISHNHTFTGTAAEITTTNQSSTTTGTASN